MMVYCHDDVIKWKHFPRYWPIVWGIHRSPVNSPHKDQWCGALMLSLICAWINAWVNNREAGDLGRRRAHYVVIVMFTGFLRTNFSKIWIKLQRSSGMKMDRKIAPAKWPPFCSGLYLKTNGSRETACVGHQLIMQIYIYIQVQHNRLREL